MAEQRTCDWCGVPGPTYEDDGHEAWFCSVGCGDAWHHEWEEQRHAELLMDMEFLDWD